MTSHPSPDGISERVDALEVLATELRRVRAQKVAEVNALNFEAAAATRMREREIQFALTADDDFILALCTLVRGASEDRAAKVTRFEVIDHRSGAEARGREFTAFDCRVSLSYQDDGRTLKAFVDDAARTPNQDSPNGR